MSKKAKRKDLERYEKAFGGRKAYEMTAEELDRPITKEIGELCRHRLEKRWYRRLIEINMLMIVGVVYFFVRNFSKNLNSGMEYVAQVAENLDTSTDELPLEVEAFFVGIGMLLVGYIGLYVYYNIYRTMSLRITERNFPEVNKIIEDYAARLGIAVPKAYVMQTGGVLNAFSTFLFKRQWICINSELFEVAYREHKDMDSLSFVIAHEMAHIYYGHATLHYNLPIWFSSYIPIIGSIASRAREYSCDRLAQRLTGVSGIQAMLVLVVDRHLYKLVDEEDYINEMRSVKGFYVWAYNMWVDHPVMSKRIVALDDGKGSGALY